MRTAIEQGQTGLTPELIPDAPVTVPALNEIDREARAIEFYDVLSRFDARKPATIGALTT